MKNVCVVGYGAIGPTHAAAINKTVSARLYAVCDTNDNAIKRCQNEYHVIGYSDFDEMLKDENIHSVHICTPHYLHFQMIKKALDAGKYVVCEKPVTMTRSEYNELLALSDCNKVCVVMQNRYNTCIGEMRKLVEEKTYGEVRGIKGVLTWQREPDYYNESNWKGKWATEGGSALINQAVHTLDLLTYLTGDVEAVSANVYNYSLKDVIETEDTVCAYLKFEDGHKGIFFATTAYLDNDSPEIQIVFENGKALYSQKKLFINGELVTEDTLPSSGKNYWGSGHDVQIHDYYDNNKYFTPYDVKNSMDTLFAVYESADKNGKEVSVK